MPLADLLGALERDAAEEARAITAVADTDVARIDEESARACNERLAIAVRTSTDEQRVLADSQLADAARRHRRAVLEARAAMLGRLRAATCAQLPAILDDALRARLVAAVVEYGDGTLRHTPTGVIVELADGTRVDATLEAMLDRSWPQLAAEAIALVDQEGS